MSRDYQMTFGLDVIVTYDSTDDCIACRAQSVVMQALVPAAAAWEATAESPRFSVASRGYWRATCFAV